MNKRVLLVSLISGIVTLFLLSACAGNAVTTSGNTVADVVAATTTSETGYHIHFFQNGKQVASLGLDELNSLPEVKLSIPGRGSDETGPTLSSVMKLAGIENYNKVRIDGFLKGRVATGELTLNKSEITDEVMFDFNNSGKAKLCGAKIPEANWIIDIAEIYAE